MPKRLPLGSQREGPGGRAPLPILKGPLISSALSKAKGRLKASHCCNQGLIHFSFLPSPSASCLCTVSLLTTSTGLYKQSGIKGPITSVNDKIAYAFLAFIAFIAFMAFFGAAAAAFAAFLAILLSTGD